jgi:voltage-gated potassium channel Kch
MQDCCLTSHAVIAGFGVPGRAAADAYRAAGVSFCVVELNPATVQRCEHVGVPIIEGDVADEATLLRAGVPQAEVLLLLVPNDKAVLAAIPIARRLNGQMKIIARCSYISSGLEAHRRGADETIVAEQVVAREVIRLLQSHTV